MFFLFNVPLKMYIYNMSLDSNGSTKKYISHVAVGYIFFYLDKDKKNVVAKTLGES